MPQGMQQGMEYGGLSNMMNGMSMNQNGMNSYGMSQNGQMGGRNPTAVPFGGMLDRGSKADNTIVIKDVKKTSGLEKVRSPEFNKNFFF